MLSTSHASTIFYPEPEMVLEDPSLACYFTPLISFTHEHLSNQQSYHIHLLGMNGLQCVKSAAYSEKGLWGFAYNNGKYRFLGDRSVFGEVNIPEVYGWLVADFNHNCEYYLHKKIKAADYAEGVQVALTSIANFEAKTYAEGIYGYLFSRAYYQRTGEMHSISEVTEAELRYREDVLLDQLEAQEQSSGFLSELQHTEHQYNIKPEMIVGGVRRARLMSPHDEGQILAALDASRQHIYMLECAY